MFDPTLLFGHIADVVLLISPGDSMRLLKAILFSVVLSLFATISFAGNFQEGVAAFNEGDHEKAFRLFMIEAKNGNSSAQKDIGIFYSNGWVVPQDNKEAVKWYRLAAEQGDAGAQYNLGGQYEKGQGVPQDYKEAVKWYRKAAEQGHALAQFNLGVLYFNGQGVLQSLEDAYAWWVVAAANGDEDAKNNMQVAQKKMTTSQIEKGQQIAKEISERIPH